MRENIKRITRDNYGIIIDKLEKLEGGFRNHCFKAKSTRRVYVVIVYKREKNIKQVIENAHFVAKYLSKNGFKTRIPIKDKKGREFIKYQFDDGYHCLALYEYIDGVTIPWEAYTRRHLKSIGKTLSDMHSVLNLKNVKKTLDSLPIWKDITRREIKLMENYFHEVEFWIEKKLEIQINLREVNKLFNDLNDLLNENYNNYILHYDFVRGNILFSENLDERLDIYPVVGILDFEKVCIGPKLADISRTLAFLIIDCKYKKEKKVKNRFLISGYEKRGKEELNSKDLDDVRLQKLMKFFWLRDFWKFLLHNPYEFLYMNEHYIRTRDRLIKSGLIDRKNSSN